MPDKTRWKSLVTASQNHDLGLEYKTSDTDKVGSVGIPFNMTTENVRTTQW